MAITEIDKDLKRNFTVKKKKLEEDDVGRSRSR